MEDQEGAPGDGEEGSRGGGGRHSKAGTGSAGAGQEGPADCAAGSTGDGSLYPYAGMGSSRAGQEGPSGGAADYTDGRHFRTSEIQGDRLAGQAGATRADVASRTENPKAVEVGPAVAGRRVQEVRAQGQRGHNTHRPDPNHLGGVLSVVVGRGRQGRHVNGVDH